MALANIWTFEHITTVEHSNIEKANIRTLANIRTNEHSNIRTLANIEYLNFLKIANIVNIRTQMFDVRWPLMMNTIWNRDKGFFLVPRYELRTGNVPRMGDVTSLMWLRRKIRKFGWVQNIKYIHGASKIYLDSQQILFGWCHRKSVVWNTRNIRLKSLKSIL